MLIEDQRFIHEDLERLEQGIADRIAEEPRNVSVPSIPKHADADYSKIRDRLKRDHEIAGFLKRIREQSQRLIDIYNDTEGLRAKEIQNVSTGDPFDQFYKELEGIKDFHRRYPNEPVENLERAYKRRNYAEGENGFAEIDSMFAGEESYGRYFDLTVSHEAYLNLPGVKRLTYIQYLDNFDKFDAPQLTMKKQSKLSDQYFRYVGTLAEYLESFLTRTKPLEDLDALFAKSDEEFEKEWAEQSTKTAAAAAAVSGPETQGTGAGTWCDDCGKEFTNENVYRNHLTGKKHIRAAEARKARVAETGEEDAAATSRPHPDATIARLKERAISEREHRVKFLSKILDTERANTRVNVERKQGMTERERQMELDALFAESAEPSGGLGGDSDGDSDSEEKIYNPLKLPLAWDGKPIPYWLYKLHGLGVEFPCEICGNFVYMGRRAFDKHFSEARHMYGLKCLGVTSQTGLFREITGISEAMALWNKLESDRKNEVEKKENVVQMEDAEGNVMPEKIYLEYVLSSSVPYIASRFELTIQKFAKAGYPLKTYCQKLHFTMQTRGFHANTTKAPLVPPTMLQSQ